MHERNTTGFSRPSPFLLALLELYHGTRGCPGDEIEVDSLEGYRVKEASARG